VWNDWFALLQCVRCRGTVVPGEFAADRTPQQLRCESCGALYPVVRGVPVMFADADRAEFLTDSKQYGARVARAESAMKTASRLSGDQLSSVRERGGELQDAIAWEALFWEQWKQDGQGYSAADGIKVARALAEDDEGGGRLPFFAEVRAKCAAANAKLLNIGAGRDFLLEHALGSGLQVVEQDIVLEPLLYLQQRGASFCVCCDARALPFGDRTFDTATAFNVIHHIWPIEQPIAELLRVTAGYVHVNEPNYFSLIRAALILPRPLKNRLKRFYSGDYSHSPYEAVIDPRRFRRAVETADGQVTRLSFTRTSWIDKTSKGIKAALRSLNLLIVSGLPVFSSHFYAAFRRR
jgi:uncharacterized protein YbaR (Trm112 family)